ncbi:HTH-type transcriptional repressor FabR [Acinetobacter bohemicus]|uniref:HTH-type transcriptional repressor FabR n=1 Tax=unclassified Acinetobacter TaxID=196816 RepID=UPI00118EC04F|nr:MULTISPECIES: HTH-type transcriptional repressor FabR [unclassified Acinetobacter]MCO8046286.1 HTH-type transcriptional repressor FabR [Acinetobacter sp. S4397-1]TSH77184.1 HTH-type transcriptional repressor FabR [Acinetobacter sp. RF15A]TSI19085.1 HTH-type transcriptional repressor FabR [Acinetobacter sp. RF15B]
MKMSSDASLQSNNIDEPIVVRSVGRKATITKEELFQAALNLIGPEKSISSLSLREVAREAGIAPNSFYRHFKDIDELAIELIDRAGIVLRQILHEARLQASRQSSIIRSSVEVFIAQLDADEGNLSLLLREGYTGSKSYKQAVERQLNYFQQELQEDLIRFERLNNKKLFHPDIVSKAITQLVFNMGANVIDMPAAERQEIAEQTMIMIRMILEGARHLEQSQLN